MSNKTMHIDAYMIFIIDHNILIFDIAMADAEIIQVSNAVDDLAENILCKRLFKVVMSFNAFE